MCPVCRASTTDIDHTAGDKTLEFYGNIMKAVCAQANIYHKRLFEATPFRTGGDEVRTCMLARACLHSRVRS